MPQYSQPAPASYGHFAPPIKLTAPSVDGHSLDHSDHLSPLELDDPSAEAGALPSSKNVSKNVSSPQVGTHLHPGPRQIRRSRSCGLPYDPSDLDFPFIPATYNTKTVPPRNEEIEDVLEHFHGEDVYQLVKQSTSIYMKASRVALMAKTLLREKERLQAELKSLQDKQASSRLSTMDKAVTSLRSILSSPKREPKSLSSQTPPSGSQHFQLGHSGPSGFSMDNIIPHSPKSHSFEIDGPSVEHAFPSGRWDPQVSTAKLILDPANDLVGSVTLSPMGASVTTTRHGAQLVPGQRVWGVGPTIEFLVLPGDNNVPVVYDCRYNRQVSNALALELKEVRNKADAEFRKEVYDSKQDTDEDFAY